MSGPAKTGSITAETQYPLGSGQGGRVGSVVVQFQSVNSFVGQVSIVGRSQRGGSDINRSLLAVAYKDFQTGANATAAITGNKSILIDASGLDVFADCTSFATGSLEFTAIPLLG